VKYVKNEANSLEDLIEGRVDVAMWDAYSALPILDAGKPVVVIAGIHAGCYELFARGAIQGIRDLKGKTVAVYAMEQSAHVLVASMLA
jgi:NitT/TauT family transport system substrate-binding protein